MANVYQCYYLDGIKEGTIESSEYQFRQGLESRTVLGSSNKQPQPSSEPLYCRYHIPQAGEVYCVASNLTHLASERQALERALKAGLKPLP